MKYIYRKIFTLIFVALGLGVLSTNAQTFTKGVAVANGGKFMATKKKDKSTFGLIENGTYNVIDYIGTTSVQSIVTGGKYAYVAFEDSIIQYNLVTRKRENYIRKYQNDYYVTKLALTDNYLVVGTQRGEGGHIEFFNKQTLDSVYEFDASVPGYSVSGIFCEGSYCYVSHNMSVKANSYTDSLGFITVIDADLLSVDATIPLGTEGRGINQLFKYNDAIYGICPATKKLLEFNKNGIKFYPVDATKALGQDGNYLFSYSSKTGISKINLTNKKIEQADSAIVPKFWGNSNLVSAAPDTINNFLNFATSNYFTVDTAFTFAYTGESLYINQVGISPEAIAVYYNTIPDAADDNVNITGDEKMIINVLENDTDSDDIIEAVEILDQPEHGVASVENNSIVYVPQAGFSGTERILYSIKDAWGDTAIAKILIEVSKVTSTISSIENHVVLYPNPVSDFLYIRNAPENAWIIISDLTGRVILESENTKALNLADLVNGMYTVTIETENEKITERIIKK